MLVPAGFLILLLLGGVSVDSAVAILGQRQLSDLTADAANDAATEALSGGAFYRLGHVVIDPGQAARAVCTDVAADGAGDVRDLRLEMAVAGDVIAVRASGEVDAVFGRSVPGFAQRKVSAQAVATAAQGPVGAPPAIGPLVPVTC
jgi:hypothetical protein